MKYLESMTYYAGSHCEFQYKRVRTLKRGTANQLRSRAYFVHITCKLSTFYVHILGKCISEVASSNLEPSSGYSMTSKRQTVQ